MGQAIQMMAIVKSTVHYTCTYKHEAIPTPTRVSYALCKGPSYTVFFSWAIDCFRNPKMLRKPLSSARFHRHHR